MGLLDPLTDRLYMVNHADRARRVLKIISEMTSIYDGEAKKKRMEFLIKKMIGVMIKEDNLDSSIEAVELWKRANLLYPDLDIGDKPPSPS